MGTAVTVGTEREQSGNRLGTEWEHRVNKAGIERENSRNRVETEWEEWE